MVEVDRPAANGSCAETKPDEALGNAGEGVAVERVDRCTYADEAAYFSFRRTTHKAEPDYGRNLSAIVLTP